MKYMGSKNRIAKYILPIMLKDRKEGQYWVEPFVGGANMIDKVDGNRIGSDSNIWVIEGLMLIRDNIDKIPKNNIEFTEDDYRKLKNVAWTELKGYASFVYSFGAKFMGGWARNKQGTDYVRNGYRNAIKQNPKLQGIDFKHCNYQELEIPENSIIYCDPPYANTTKYKDDFDHEEFWQWCRDMSGKGHTVFVSEYNAPDDFEFIYEKEINSSFHHSRVNNSKKGIEKLFKYKGI